MTLDDLIERLLEIRAVAPASGLAPVIGLDADLDLIVYEHGMIVIYRDDDEIELDEGD